MFKVTFPIFITAYCIGLLVALNLEKGTITSASKTKIQMVYVMYSTFISDQLESVFLKSKAKNKKANEDQNMEIVAVEITFFLLSSLL